jgi:hypothetical protein
MQKTVKWHWRYVENIFHFLLQKPNTGLITDYLLPFLSLIIFWLYFFYHWPEAIKITYLRYYPLSIEDFQMSVAMGKFPDSSVKRGRVRTSG